METKTVPESNQASNFIMHSSFRHLKYYDFSCFQVKLNLIHPYDICYPNIGYVTLNLLCGDHVKVSFLSHNISGSKNGHLYVSGLLSGAPLITRHHGQGYLHAIKLHPVIAYHLLKEKMHYTTDQHTLFTDIIEKEGQLLRQLENDQQIDSLDHQYIKSFLLKHLPEWHTIQRDPIFHAVNTIIKRKGIIRIRELAAQFCMSERTFHRQFLLKVGLSPKAYAKIWQWQYVMELLQNSSDISLQELAFKAGYYDAAHLEHDFQDKLFQTPFQFRQNISPLVEDYLNIPGSL